MFRSLDVLPQHTKCGWGRCMWKLLVRRPCWINDGHNHHPYKYLARISLDRKRFPPRAWPIWKLLGNSSCKRWHYSTRGLSDTTAWSTILCYTTSQGSDLLTPQLVLRIGQCSCCFLDGGLLTQPSSPRVWSVNLVKLTWSTQRKRPWEYSSLFGSWQISSNTILPLFLQGGCEKVFCTSCWWKFAWPQDC